VTVDSWQVVPVLFCVARLILVVVARRYHIRWPVGFLVEFVVLAAVWISISQANPALILGTTILSAAVTGFLLSVRKWVHAFALIPLIGIQIAITFGLFAGAAGVFSAPSCWPGEYVNYMNECDYN